jgi:ATP-dependent 26S proteasome regulatory subunit
MLEKITDNKQKIKQNKVLPYLVGNVVEVSPTLSELISFHPGSTDSVTRLRFWTSMLRTRMMVR